MSGFPVLRGGRRCLAETHPEFVRKLVDSSVATRVHAGSTVKAEWLCERGHRYVSPIRNVVQFGRGCNVCAGKVVIAGVNDVATTHPEIARMMVDQDLAQKVSAGSNKKVEFVCDVDDTHRWWAAPNTVLQNWVKRGSEEPMGCPYCSGRIVVPGMNDVLTSHPELASEAVDRDEVSHLSEKSNKRVMWRCSEGHTWQASIASRTAGTGCPYCSGRLAIEGKNDLATLSPELASELVEPSLARRLKPGSHEVVAWHCDLGHVWEASVEARAMSGSGCPYCAGKRAIPGETDLATLRPDLADELVDESLAESLTLKSNRKVRWRCACGHEWDATVSSRTSEDGCGCPYCSGRIPIPGETDLATTHPELAAQLADPSLGTRISYGSNRVVEWRCAEGHVWSASPKSRVSAATGCPICTPTGTSAKERAFIDFVREVVGDDMLVIEHDREVLGNGMELDVVVKGENGLCVAFEFNGVWWHSEAAGRSRSYHRDKFLAAREAGCELVFIWEDDWDRRREWVANVVRFATGKSGCVNDFDKACEIDSDVAGRFFDAYGYASEQPDARAFGGFDADGNLCVVAMVRVSSYERMELSVSIAMRCYSLWSADGFLGSIEAIFWREGYPVRKWVMHAPNGTLAPMVGLNFDFYKCGEYEPCCSYAGRSTGWQRRGVDDGSGLTRVWDAGGMIMRRSAYSVE